MLESEWDASAGKIRDDVFGQRISELSAFKAEQDIRKNSLPASPDKYEVKLSPDFKAPEGAPKFEFDMNDPALKNIREIAHRAGLDQETFSKVLDVYAATEIGKYQKLAVARDAETSKLGSAATQRIDAVETWLKARVGPKADVLVAQMRNFPVASMVETFEEIARQFSNQGGASYSQSHRSEPENSGRIEGYENMNFRQRRAAQDAAMANQRRTAAGGR